MRLVGILVLVLILAGGGGYYYFFILEPQNYLKAVLEFKRGFDEKSAVLSKADIDGRTDYQGALKVLGEREQFIKDSKDKFSKIPLPYFGEDFREFRKIFLGALDGHELANQDARARAKLLASFSDLGNLIDPDQKPPFNEKTAYVRDLQAYFEKTFGNLKKAMNDTLKVKAPKINGEAEFEKLKSLWVDTEPALDITLSFVRAQNPNAKLAGYSPAGQTRRFQEASEKVTKFGEALKKILESNTTYDILAHRFFEGLDAKVLKPNSDATKALEVLKSKYAK